MNKYICTQLCSELDWDNSPHCSTNDEERVESGYCPCGNYPKWDKNKEEQEDAQ